MNRKRKIRQMRKEILRLGEIESVQVLKSPGLPKKEWGYVVHACINGEHISAVDDSWYGAWKGCLECARWAAHKPLNWKVEYAWEKNRSPTP